MRYKLSLYLMCVLYVAAGFNHFVHAESYLKIMPPWVPWPKALVVVSGVSEVLLALLLLPAKTRTVAAWALIVLLIAVFPANVQMMLNYFREGHPYRWFTVLRLPLQVILVLWAYVYTKPLGCSAVD